MNKFYFNQKKSKFYEQALRGGFLMCIPITDLTKILKPNEVKVQLHT